MMWSQSVPHNPVRSQSVITLGHNSDDFVPDHKEVNRSTECHNPDVVSNTKDVNRSTECHNPVYIESVGFLLLNMFVGHHNNVPVHWFTS